MKITAGLVFLLMLFGCDRPASESAQGRIGIGEVLGENGENESGVGSFAYADRVVDFEFPRDHGPHSAFRSEWWYLTVVLETSGGRTFGVQFTLFRQALRRCDESCDGWRGAQVYLGHVGLADVDSRSHREWERISRGHPELAGVRVDPFEAFIENWRLTANASFEEFSLDVPLTGGSIELDMEVVQPVTLQGDRGLSMKGPDNASYYYSIPRLHARGRIDIDGESHPVTGLAWLDREWSTSVLAPEFVGWDWFALHFDRGDNVMAFQLRRRDGAASEYNAGSMINVAGASESLTAEDLEFNPIDTWRGWPIEWRLRVRGEEWRVKAAFADQVMNTSIRYWEGVVDIFDEDDERVGRGYLEMTGYTP